MSCEQRLSVVEDPFFILYDARSGSTFLADRLVKRANAVIPPETNFVTSLLSQYEKRSIDNSSELDKAVEIILADEKFQDWNIGRGALKCSNLLLPLGLEALIGHVFALYRESVSDNADLFGIKKGSYIDYYEEIKALFPASRFVGIVRDGRAVFNSKKNSIQSETGEPFETDPCCAAQEWCRKLRILREIDKIHHQDTLVVHYEEMIKHPDKTLDLVCRFLGASNASESSANREGYPVPSRYGALHENVDREALSSRISAWQRCLSKEEIYAFESVAYQCLLSEGYELINERLTSPYLSVKRVCERVRRWFGPPERQQLASKR